MSGMHLQRSCIIWETRMHQSCQVQLWELELPEGLACTCKYGYLGSTWPLMTVSKKHTASCPACSCLLPCTSVLVLVRPIGTVTDVVEGLISQFLKRQVLCCRVHHESIETAKKCTVAAVFRQEAGSGSHVRFMHSRTYATTGVL